MKQRDFIFENYDLSFLYHDCEWRSYFLGYWIADGWMDKQGSIRISSAEIEAIENLARITNFKNKIITQASKQFNAPRLLTGHTQYTLAFGNKYVFQYFSDLGFTPKKTGHEFIPSIISDETFPHFLRGFLDGDGSFMITTDRKKKRLQCGFTSFSFDFLEEIRHKLVYLKIVGSGNHPYWGLHAYNLKYGHSDSVRIGDFIYRDSTICLTRKYKKYLEGKQIKKVFTPWTLEEIEMAINYQVPKGRTAKACEIVRTRIRQGIKKLPS